MKAIVHSQYGGPDVLRLVDVERPKPADDEILVRVHAAALNPADWHVTRGTPYPIRFGSGLKQPKTARRVGLDYAGTVAARGRTVTRFEVGDAVFGGGEGSLAEYLTVKADRGVARKPGNVTFDQAAGVAVAGVTALQALRNKAQVQQGQTVLINGAAGGVGTFAVQLAKAFGADVTGVQSTRNLEFVRSIGADHVIDYTKDDFTNRGERYDVVLDNIGNHSVSDTLRVVKPGGTYLPNVGGGPEDPASIGRMAWLLVMSPFISQKIRFFLASPNRDDLETLAGLMEAGTVTTAIDRCYPLSDAPEAMRRLESRHARGKVIVTMPPA